MRLAAPDLPDEARAEQLARFREAVRAGTRRLADTRVWKDGAGNLRAALRIAPLGADTRMLAGPFGADDAAAAELVPEVVARLRELGVRAVLSRPDAARAGPLYRAALAAHGFLELGARVEFKTPVADLPLDDGTPLAWRDLDAVGMERAAAALAECAAGDPHARDEVANPRGELAGWLGAPRLTSGPECVQVGFRDGRAVAFVCAQVAPADGWSRVTYMGLVPEARGRGLGAWVHRRGFRMLKEQGGTLYHGGTAEANAAMVGLFRKHGCRQVARLLELEWRA